jgi:hypothetical protein
MSYRLRQIRSRSGTALYASTHRPHLPDFHCCFKDMYVSVPGILPRLCFDAYGLFIILSQQRDWGMQFLASGRTFISALVVELDSSHCACCGGKG